MTNDSRLDVRLPAQQRRELEQLAKESGLTLPSVMRLAAARLLNDRDGLLHGSQTELDARTEAAI